MATHSTGKPSFPHRFVNVFHWILSLVCGGHLIATSAVQQLYSHANFGGFNYDNNAACDWIIEADPGTNVQLTFTSFDVRLLVTFEL